MLLAREIDISAESTDSLTLTLPGQTVCLNLAEGGQISEQTMRDINNDSLNDKYELLQIMLTNTIS